MERGGRSQLLKDPHVKRVWDLINGESLFKMSVDDLASLRESLRRESLGFFAHHSSYYAELFERLDIVPAKATLHDVAKLAIPSDMLRGDGQKRFLIQDLEEDGETFSSSGTTGKDPVRVYRSPIDLAIMLKANTDLFEYVYGDLLKDGEGVALFMAAPELRYKLSFVAFVHLTLEKKGIELLYGMDLENKDQAGTPWQKLVPNRENLLKFLKSKKEPKLFFTAPAGVHLMCQRFEDMGIGKKMAYKLASGAPPVRLGKGGVVVTGGGSKGFADLPEYPKLVSSAQRHFKSQDRSGKAVDTPFMDVLGMTETLTALIDRYGVMDKMPHPLSEVFILDPLTFELVEGEGKEGVLGIFNPFTTSWLEVFYPGDIMTWHSSPRYYGKEFVYKRRLSVKEGWDLQRACGGTLEEMMTKGQ
jgi:phenylacetate-CoA ligase